VATPDPRQDESSLEPRPALGAIRWLPLGLLGALVLAFAVRKVSSLDVWWHLAAGKWIWEHGQVPRVDVFSHTAAGQPWVDVHWLFQALGYPLFTWFGLNVLVILPAVLFLAAFAVSVLTARKEQRGPVLAVLAFLGVLISQVHFLPRPTFVTAFFVAAYLWVLERECRGRTRWLWMLPVCHVVWANMHGVAAVGIVMVAIVAAAEFWSLRCPLPEQWRQAAQPSARRLKRLLAVAALCLAASCLNPYGLREVAYAWGQFGWVASGAHPVARLLGELKPSLSPDFAVHPLSYFSHWAFTLLTMASFVLNRKRLRLSSLLVYGAFLYLFVSSYRNSILFALVAIPLATENLANWLEELRKSGRDILSLRVEFLATMYVSVPVAIAVGVAASGDYYNWDNGDYEPGFGLQPGFYPEWNAAWLAERGFQGKLYNDPDLGGYLVWRLYPKVPVFLDGRHEVYGPVAVENALARGHPDAFLAMMRKYDISLALVHHADPVNRELLVRLASDRDWQVVQYDLVSILFVRNDGKNQALWDSLVNTFPWKYEELDPHCKGSLWIAEWDPVRGLPRMARLYEDLGVGYEKSDRPRLALNAYWRAVETGYASGRAYYNLGSLHLKCHELAQAVPFLEKAVQLAPDFAPAHYNLGVALEFTGQPDKAIPCYERAVQADSRFTAALNNLGRLLARNGQVDRARTLWQRSLEVNPDQPKVREWLNQIGMPSDRPQTS
jgi:tetratricopeptide (TPR) repeat protein